MRSLYNKVSFQNAESLTKSYSTSFSLATKMLSGKIRPHIYNIYGFVRVADEIVDTFHDSPQKEMLDEFEKEYYNALERGISTNPIVNAFICSVKEFDIQNDLVEAFLKSMRTDLYKTDYLNDEELAEYIYGSADVVGLMCLNVFVSGDREKYNELEHSAKKLGSAFQKVNFLRDLKNDNDNLNRKYFPGIDVHSMSKEEKQKVIEDIEKDFEEALAGIKKLPMGSKLGVYVAYRYYSKLLKKIKNTPIKTIAEERIRISNGFKAFILFKSLLRYQLKWF